MKKFTIYLINDPMQVTREALKSRMNFVFRTDQTLHFKVSCSLVPQNPHIRPCPEHNMLSIIRNYETCT